MDHSEPSKMNIVGNAEIGLKSDKAGLCGAEEDTYSNGSKQEQEGNHGTSENRNVGLDVPTVSPHQRLT
jgi:hypothetical protein